MERFQVLSLDGGGIRGVFIAAFLAEIEDRNKTNITDHFDLIVGTSTGGIIALGLGMGMSAKEILTFYEQNAESIFPSSFPNYIRKHIPFSAWLEPKNYQSLILRKYCNRPLEDALKSALPDLKLGHSNKRLVIPSFDVINNEVKLFKTAHHARFTKDYKYPAWQVGLATSAAPTFFSASNAGNRPLIDGGVWANDPTMVGISEAIGVLNQSPESIKVLSIGTLKEVRKFASSKKWGGKLPWIKKGRIINMMMSAQSASAQGQARIILSDDSYIRINPPVPENIYGLDDTERINDLQGIAEHSAEHQSEEIARKFLNHKSPEFSPLHKVTEHD